MPESLLAALLVSCCLVGSSSPVMPQSSAGSVVQDEATTPGAECSIAQAEMMLRESDKDPDVYCDALSKRLLSTRPAFIILEESIRRDPACVKDLRKTRDDLIRDRNQICAKASKHKQDNPSLVEAECFNTQAAMLLAMATSYPKNPWRTYTARDLGTEETRSAFYEAFESLGPEHPCAKEMRRIRDDLLAERESALDHIIEKKAEETLKKGAPKETP